MSASTPAVYRSSAAGIVPRPLCGATGNPLVVAEAGIEHRFDMPVRDYHQAGCRACGLLYINAPVEQDYLNRLYANETVEWAAELLGSPDAAMNDDERARFSDVVDLVAHFTPLGATTQWLASGCQTGDLGEDAMRKHGVIMSGVEISPDYAARAARLWGRDPAAVQSSLDGHGAAQLDVITSLETLEHMAAPWEMVDALKARLKPRSVLAVSVPSSDYFRLKYHVFKLARSIRSRAASKERSLFGLCHTHLYNFTPKSLRVLLEKQGLAVEYVAGIGWLSRYRAASKAARVIEGLTGGRVAIFPNVIAVARKR